MVLGEAAKQAIGRSVRERRFATQQKLWIFRLRAEHFRREEAARRLLRLSGLRMSAQVASPQSLILSPAR